MSASKNSSKGEAAAASSLLCRWGRGGALFLLDAFLLIFRGGAARVRDGGGGALIV